MTSKVGNRPAGLRSLTSSTKDHTQKQQSYVELTPPPTPSFMSNKFTDIDSLTSKDFDFVAPGEEPLVAVMGCGYVGTNLIGEFSTHYDVLGFDVSPRQLAVVKEIYNSESYRVDFTLDPEDLSKATHFLISVPTLLQSDKSIDTSYIRSALDLVAKYGRRGATVVIESSVAVGMTRQLLGPIAQEKGFFGGMSPERVDPGRTEPPLHTIPKIISGLDDIVPGSLNSILRLYTQVFDTVHPVSKPEVAEMTKLYENCQRMLCIAYANEMADACTPHEIDPYEVCRAAATKPFGYMPYTPGLGVGGHCIPVNPYYLLSNSTFPLLQAATEKMWQRPTEIGQKIVQTLVGSDKFSSQKAREQDVCVPPSPTDSAIDVSLDGRPRVLVVGVGFKAGQSVLSHSPGWQLANYLAGCGEVSVTFADPLVAQSAIPTIPRLSDGAWNKQQLETFDMVVVALKQTGLDLSLLDRLDDVQVEMYCA